MLLMDEFRLFVRIDSSLLLLFTEIKRGSGRHERSTSVMLLAGKYE